MRRRAALLLIAAAAAGCASADVAPRDASKFQLDWQTESEPRGALVRGQLRNGHPLPARDIHLLVEGLDASGRAVTSSTTVLRRIVLSGERAPFLRVCAHAGGAARRQRCCS